MSNVARVNLLRCVVLVICVGAAACAAGCVRSQASVYQAHLTASVPANQTVALAER